LPQEAIERNYGDMMRSKGHRGLPSRERL
jgi:hypothetical protein